MLPLLDTLALAGATVTLDVAGTQPTIAARTRARGADYVPTLHELIADHCAQVATDASGAPSLAAWTAHDATVAKDHSRLELRAC